MNKFIFKGLHKRADLVLYKCAGMLDKGDGKIEGQIVTVKRENTAE